MLSRAIERAGEVVISTTSDIFPLLRHGKIGEICWYCATCACDIAGSCIINGSVRTVLNGIATRECRHGTGDVLINRAWDGTSLTFCVGEEVEERAIRY